MPTYEAADSFKKELARLTAEQRRQWQIGLKKFIEDLKAIEAGQQQMFRPGLRVTGVVGLPGAYEMTWADDGRAIWSYGEPKVEGMRHVQWLHVGTHDIF